VRELPEQPLPPLTDHPPADDKLKKRHRRKSVVEAQPGIPCPSCGHGNRPDRRFCTECGHRLGRMGSLAGRKTASAAPISAFLHADGKLSALLALRCAFRRYPGVTPRKQSPSFTLSPTLPPEQEPALQDLLEEEAVEVAAEDVPHYVQALFPELNFRKVAGDELPRSPARALPERRLQEVERLLHLRTPHLPFRMNLHGVLTYIAEPLLWDEKALRRERAAYERDLQIICKTARRLHSTLEKTFLRDPEMPLWSSLVPPLPAPEQKTGSKELT
jgi:zinc ribbon protein